MVSLNIGIFECIMTFIAGIGAFLYGCKLLSGNVDKIAGSRLRKLIQKFSSNALLGILFGTFLSFVMQSGTASVGMVIGLAVVDIISTAQAVNIIIGINIGTSLAIILLGFTGSTFSLTALFMALTTVGVCITMFTKSNKGKAIGNIVTGFGISFVGVIMIGKGTTFISTSNLVKDILASVNNVGTSSLFGAILTILTQSTTSLITMMSGMSEFLVIDQCGFILFASNIGTAIATLLFVGITSNRKGFRISMSYLVLKIGGYILFVIISLLIPWEVGLYNLLTNSLIPFISQNSYLWTLIFINIIYSVGTGIVFGFMNKLLTKFVYFIVPKSEVLVEAKITHDSDTVAMAQIGVKIQNLYIDYYKLLSESTNFILSEEKDSSVLMNSLNELYSKVETLQNEIYQLGGVVYENEFHLKTCLTNTIIGVEKSITNTIKLLKASYVNDERIFYTTKQQPFISFLNERLISISKMLKEFIVKSKNQEETTSTSELLENILTTLNETVEKKLEAKKYIITAEHSSEKAVREYTSFGNVINYFEEISTNLADLSLNLAGYINANNKTSENLV